MNETPRGFFLFDEYSLENPLVHWQINDRELSDISFDEDDDEQIKKNGLNKTKHNKGEKELLYFLYIYKLWYNM
jgi:hypothetical protein